MEKRIIKSAIVGCGVIGPTHAGSIRDLEDAKLIAVCDVVKEKADKMAAEFGAKAYYDADEMLANEPDIDVVHVCVPSGLHHVIGIKAAKAGKHVITEKPIDVTVEQADMLINACRIVARKACITVAVKTGYKPVQILDRQKSKRINAYYIFDLINGVLACNKSVT